MAKRLFSDRREAGRFLATRLKHYRKRDNVVVLALPRGGVPVGYEIATALGAPLDIFVVRKLGAPVHEELAMGAIASGGVVVPNLDVIRSLGISDDQLATAADAEARELRRREQAYRDNRPPPDVKGKVAILVDDGLATGSSMRAAVQALRRLGPSMIVVAVPVAPSSTCQRLATEVDDVVCGMTPSPFFAVGQAYEDFTQTTDEEVRSLLQAAWSGKPHSEDAPADLRAVRSSLVPLLPGQEPFPDIGEVHLALLGEATHGTQEFYAERARLTRWLIEEKGFNAVAVEADWPDAYRVNRYVRGLGTDATAEESLRGFRRFPTWMWRNTVVSQFVEWLREHNSRLPEQERVGFYGLDLYSLYTSMHEVICYLDRVNPEAANRARERYACFDHFGEDARNYGFAAAFGAGDSCEAEVVEQLMELHRSALETARKDGMPSEEEHFYAEQNARTVKAAEEYYRTLVQGHVTSWNLRDRHMTDTLDELAAHLRQQRADEVKIAVWAHNSHLGDARSTELGMRGELNIGEMVRTRHPKDSFLLGFTTYEGTVTAASLWGGPADRKTVRPALEESFEKLFHDAGEKAFLLDLGDTAAGRELKDYRLERAIGVVYHPQDERQSHYFRARLAGQFDAVIHFDQSSAVDPLERSADEGGGELPETYPHAV